MLSKDKLKYSLGANMYTRGTILSSEFLLKLLNNKYTANSITLDLEDSISDKEYKDAYKNVLYIINLLNAVYKVESSNKLPYIFIRVRDSKCYERILNDLQKDDLEYKNVLKGLVLPKYSVGEYNLDLLKGLGLYVLPVLESYAIFNKETRYVELKAIKEHLNNYENYVLGLRVGIMDFMNYMGVRRPYGKDYVSVYDQANIKDILGDIVNYFGSDYVISGGVTDNYKDVRALKRDIELDKFNGFIGKTVIHPSQVGWVQEGLKVSLSDYEDALQVMCRKDKVMSSDVKGTSMLESKVMLDWAEKTVTLAGTYGIKLDGVELSDASDISKYNKLFTLGLRNGNSKRQHLIISKVIGKHIAVDPRCIKLVGQLLFIGDLISEYKLGKVNIVTDIDGLQALYYDLELQLYSGNYSLGNIEELVAKVQDCITVEGLSRKYCVLGFCETATGISKAVYDIACKVFRVCIYVSSTRFNSIEIKNDIIINFEEEHSHLTKHSLILQVDRMGKFKHLDEYDRLVCVDDEFTTCKTVNKIIDKLLNVYNFKNIGLCSVIRGKAIVQGKWDTITSILEHNYTFNNLGVEYKDNIKERDITKNVYDDCYIYIYHNDKCLQGVSGYTEEADAEYYNNRAVYIAGKIAQRVTTGDKVLIVGVGEYMSLGIDVGVKLSVFNLDIEYKSITKSPIYVDGHTIKSRDIVRWCKDNYYYYNYKEDLKKYDKIIFIGYR